MGQGMKSLLKVGSRGQKQLCYLPGRQGGRVLQGGQGHHWLPWDQQGHWALALQGLPTQEEAGGQQKAI